MTINSEALIKRLDSEINLTRLMISPARDSTYTCPSIRWVKEFSSFLTGADHPAYVYETWDCDDFAFWASTQASIARWRGEAGNSGHTVLIVYVTLNKSTLGINVEGALEHACLLILTRDAGWVFLDPQTGVIQDAKQILNDDYSRPTCVVNYAII